MANQTPGSVVLAEHESALELLHSLLGDAAAAFPNALGATGLPATTDRFRDVYPDVLPRFEAARLASRKRNDITGHLVAALQKHVYWLDTSGRRPLHETLAEPAQPLPLEMHAFGGEPGWLPSLTYQGERWEGARLAELGELLMKRRLITQEASEALAWIVAEVMDAGVVCLAGRRIAVLGGGAEMAPTRFLLQSGADVLWLDTTPPPRSWWETPNMSGRLYWPPGGADLLTNPRQVLATLLAFADGAPLDLGLYAYAPGQARELRLTASMNALVDTLPAQLIASVTMLVSPTTPTALSSRDRSAMRERIEARPAWEALCARLGLLGRGRGSAEAGEAAATRTVVAIQGASYQAAQYLGKILTAERWSRHGTLASTSRNPLRVSANTAAITRTRSLSHPVFAAAFGGATAFGVETLVPRQSRCLNGLLAIRDWLHPALPTPGTVRVHGGLHTLPYPLGPALRVAAAIGFARSPRLLRGLIVRR